MELVFAAGVHFGTEPTKKKSYYEEKAALGLKLGVGLGLRLGLARLFATVALRDVAAWLEVGIRLIGSRHTLRQLKPPSGQRGLRQPLIQPPPLQAPDRSRLVTGLSSTAKATL